MTNKEAAKKLRELPLPKLNGNSEEETETWLNTYIEPINIAIKALEQQPCEDCISRSSIKQKLQKHRDFFTKAYSGYSYLPQNDKSRVDEITNCISMVVNEPPVAPQHYKGESEGKE